MMTMTIESNQHRFGPLSFDHMSTYSGHHHPQFTNPWVSSSSATGSSHHNGNHNLYPSSQDSTVLPHLNLGTLPKHPQHGGRNNSSASMASYTSLPVTAASAGSSPITDLYRQQDLLSMSQDLLSLNRLQPPSSSAYDTSAYTTTASPVNPTYAPSPAAYDQLGYAPPAPLRGPYAMASEDSSRRYSQQSVASSYVELGPSAEDGSGRLPGITLSNYDRRGLQPDDRRSFQDALEASHGMLSMSQDTPRNIYDVRNRGRGSGDSYGFPPTHSTNSSISSAGFNGYYGSSVDGSVSDYSTTGSDIESLSGRTALPRPQGLMSPQPPVPQSMMSSFSSKVSTNTQKKHKCKVCDKRFTRPSSLQTHMYSHTGEKPFSCEVEGCGRHFSVVSNLRRHKKVHRNQGETPSETGSEDHHSE